MSAEPVLSTRGLTWTVGGRRILGPLDLDVVRGELLAVIGPNGAGKTTLLRLLTGVLAPSSGQLLLGATPYPRLSPRQRARHLAYVPQKGPSSVPLTVEEVVLLGRFPHLSPFQIAPTAGDRGAVAAALEVVGLEAFRRRPVDALSGGERQLTSLAACLAQEADLLVLDEPTTFLDPRHQRQIARVLRALTRDHGKTVIAATHDLHFATSMADRVAGLKEGRLVACREPAAVLASGLLEQVFGAPFERLAAGGGRPRVLVRLDG